MPKRPPRVRDLIRRTNPLMDAIRGARETVSEVRGVIRSVADELRPMVEPLQEEAPSESAHDVSVACLDCVRGHLMATSGALAEGLRFAREGGVRHPEAIARIAIAEEELDMAERVDLHPSKLAGLQPEHREVADWVLPRLRTLRHTVTGIRNAADMEKAAAEAHTLSRELVARVLECQRCGQMISLKEFMERRRR